MPQTGPPWKNRHVLRCFGVQCWASDSPRRCIESMNPAVLHLPPLLLYLAFSSRGHGEGPVVHLVLSCPTGAVHPRVLASVRTSPARGLPLTMRRRLAALQGLLILLIIVRLVRGILGKCSASCLGASGSLSFAPHEPLREGPVPAGILLSDHRPAATTIRLHVEAHLPRTPRPFKAGAATCLEEIVCWDSPLIDCIDALDRGTMRQLFSDWHFFSPSHAAANQALGGKRAYLASMGSKTCVGSQVQWTRPLHA